MDVVKCFVVTCSRPSVAAALVALAHLSVLLFILILIGKGVWDRAKKRTQFSFDRTNWDFVHKTALLSRSAGTLKNNWHLNVSDRIDIEMCCI